MAETELITLEDDTQVRVPAGLTDAELKNVLASAMPARMAKYGIFYNVEREYDTKTGVADAGVRFDASLARGNPEETASVLNEKFGEGNWGITPQTTIPFVTPDGLRHAGIEPKDDRKVLLKESGLSVYDIIDIAPEIAIGAAAMAAELIPIPGTSVAGAAAARGILGMLRGRGLVARNTRAGIAAGVASGGVEAVQALRGHQKESTGEILSRAGTEAALIGLAGLAIGAPIMAVTGGASKAITAARGMSPDMRPKPLGVADISAMKAAQKEVEKVLGTQDSILLSFRTILGPESGAAASIIKIAEGLGARQIKEKLPDFVRNSMDKFREIVKETAGLSDEMVAKTLRDRLTSKEVALFNKTFKELGKFTDSWAGKIDAAAGSLSGMKTYADELLQAEFKKGQTSFARKYAAFNRGGELSNTIVDSATLAKYLQQVSKNTGFKSDDVLNMFETSVKKTKGEGSSLADRVKSRVRVDRKGNVNKRSADSRPKGSDISVKDLLDMDRAIRRAAFNAESRALTRSSLKISEGATKALTQKLKGMEQPLIPSKLLENFKSTNREYHDFMKLYTGKDGLLARLGEANQAKSADQFLRDFIGGKTGSDIGKMLKNMDEVFGPDSLQRKEILSNMGFHFVRESNEVFEQLVKEGADSKAIKAAAKAELKKVNSIEKTLRSRMGRGTSKETNQAIKEIFGLESFKTYKDLLSKMSTGAPKVAKKAYDQSKQIMSFSQAEKFVDKMKTVGSKLSREEGLDDVVAEMKRLTAIDKDGGMFFRELIFSENWSKVINSANAEKPELALTALRDWASDWIQATGKPNGTANVKALMPGRRTNSSTAAQSQEKLFNDMNNLALTVQGALDIDPVAGALSTAEIVPSFFKSILRLDFKGAVKPLSYMYVTKSFAPGSKVWTELNRRLMARGSIDPEELVKEMTKGTGGKAASMLKRALSEGERAGSAALAGRNGLLAASIANYMSEADAVYPTEYEIAVRTLAADKIPGSGFDTQVPSGIVDTSEQASPTTPTAPNLVPTSAVIPQDTGLTAIQQIAKMIQPVAGSGVSALDEGAALARAAER